MKEVWKDVEGYKGCYQVSTEGRVKSLVRKGKLEEIILKFGLGTSGYLHTNLFKNGKVKTFYVHRLVAVVFIPNLYNLQEVNHKNGIKIDNIIENLEWCLRKENMKHRDEILGINCRGENHGQVKLTEKEILEIRKSKLKLKELSKMYKVSISHISHIKNNKFWKHLQLYNKR